MNPVEKRLAVMVPDHPVEYVDFEGIIPEGHYGAGPVVIWDEGTYAVPEGESPESQLQAGTLVFTLNGRKLKGGFALTRLARGQRGNEWLLIKRKDEHADPAWSLESKLSPRRLRTLAVRVPPCDGS